MEEIERAIAFEYAITDCEELTDFGCKMEKGDGTIYIEIKITGTKSKVTKFKFEKNV